MIKRKFGTIGGLEIGFATGSGFVVLPCGNRAANHAVGLVCKNHSREPGNKGRAFNKNFEIHEILLIESK
jgi:hypothetical protein